MVERSVKCLVWDLDDTLWDGVVLEGDGSAPRPAARRVLEILDRRGILHAAASRGEHDATTEHLRLHGIEDMFCELRVGWGPKSESIRSIASSLNIGLETLAFVDNDPVERAEVSRALSEVRVYPAERLAELPELTEFTPETRTEEAGRRRALYRTERFRERAEESFTGSSAEFLATLDLELTVGPATEVDLARAHELTVRTHQLNTTGMSFGVDELRALTASDRHEVLVATLRDRFGHYGTIGLAVTEVRGDDVVLQLLLLSCRVMSRGVGPALIQHVVNRARARGRRMLSEFVPTEVNRVMLVTLRFAGFEVVEAGPDPMLLAYLGTGTVPGVGHVRIVDRDEETP